MRDLPVRTGEPLFLDSVHLIASFSPTDNWRNAAIAASILTADQEFARAGYTPLLRRYLD